MKKPASQLPVPDTYAFDDTPKAFKRMMQRKNGDPQAFKKAKQQQADNFDHKRTRDTETTSTAQKSANTANTSTDTPTKKHSPAINQSQKNPQSLATGFKTVRAKRKAHLQARDLKKKLKRFDSAQELPSHPSHLRRHVRDVVQEPPKLHQPKKTFKKVKDEKEEIKSWSDYEDEDLIPDEDQ